MRDGWRIELTGKGVKEFTSSSDTRAMRYNTPTEFADKMRMAANLDEIIQAAENWERENPNHPRKDDIVGFNRANVRVRVGQNDYTAEIVTGVKPNTKEIFYNIVNLQPTKIKTSIVKRASERSATDTTDSDGSLSNINIAQQNHPVNPDNQEPQNKRTPTVIQAGANGTLTPVGGNEGPSNVNVPRKRQTVNPQTTETEEGPRYSRPVRDEAQLRQEMEQAREESRRLKEERDAWEDSQEVRELKARRLQMREHKAPLPGRGRRRGGYRRLGGAAARGRGRTWPRLCATPAAATTAPALWKTKANQAQQQTDRKLTVSRGNNYLGGFAKHLQTVRAGK